MVEDGAFIHGMDYVTISKSQRASKSHYWFKSYGNDGNEGNEGSGR